jgi:hypothetical protein
MRHLKNQAILLSIIYGLIPIIELCFRLLNIGERMSNEFHLIIGIVSLILISFPIGIFITQIREKNYESAYLKENKYLFRFFVFSLILNTISIPILGLESSMKTFPSVILGWIIISLFISQRKKCTETKANILDEKIF